VFLDGLQVLVRFGAGSLVAKQQLGVAEDDPQGVVDFVGDAGG
jgi:hypothetical protein